MLDAAVAATATATPSVSGVAACSYSHACYLCVRVVLLQCVCCVGRVEWSRLDERNTTATAVSERRGDRSQWSVSAAQSIGTHHSTHTHRRAAPPCTHEQQRGNEQRTTQRNNNKTETKENRAAVSASIITDAAVKWTRTAARRERDKRRLQRLAAGTTSQCACEKHSH